MKSINFKVFFTLVLSTFFLACSSSAPEPTNPNPDPDPDPIEVTSIVLSANTSSVEVGQEVTFTVKTNTNQDVTSQASFTVNGSSISGNVYTPSTEGSYAIKATYSTFTSNEITITATSPPATVTSISISADVTESNIGDTITYSVEATMSDGSTQDQTNQSTFYIDNNEITGNAHLNVAAGSVVAYAKLGSLTSNNLTIQVNDVSAPTSYNKKAIIEDYTGTWCGWCPRVSYAIEQVESQSDKVFVVAAHIGDSMENAYTRSLRDAFGVTGYPTAWVNREAKWSYPEPSNVNQAVDEAQGTVSQGLAVNSLLSGNNISIVVSTGFSQANSGAKLVVFILEDGIVQSQANYTSYYTGNPIAGFVHNHILRHSLTDVMGDNTSTSVGVNHNVYNLTVPSTVVDANNIGVLAILVDSSGRNVINAQYSKINVDKDFD